MYQLSNPLYEAFRQHLVQEARQKYHESQRDTLPEARIVKARCMEFTKAFCIRFPELRPERGWVKTAILDHQDYKGQEHWWCVAPDSTIVDPTLNQFGFWDRELVYTVFNPEVDHIYIGKCCNCGMEIYGLEAEGPAEICPPEEGEEVSECAASYERYLRSEAARYRQ
jgi:hypothetical protein